ncbi:CshA/CshB family fibrillar adhesin-related protein [Streptococcus sp. IMAU 99161]|uniref:CshA/CshB family fibrillar adhesin-related protein n=1 Tax=Streptococcus sp. IMAU 99161 TaxID=2710601 RepID=UPI001655FBBF|nr:CshA/CshB family fibrillar adhesin-related protein [Streptococcus sp. IMAU 99161]MBC8775970.1 YSIRK-type signal peptide-containing protein [Streptococcus sp. IMAU 99161]
MGKDLFNDRISRFSIRKLNVGVCSVLLGTLVMVGTAATAAADEQTDSNSNSVAAVTTASETPATSTATANSATSTAPAASTYDANAAITAPATSTAPASTSAASSTSTAASAASTAPETSTAATPKLEVTTPANKAVETTSTNADKKEAPTLSAGQGVPTNNTQATEETAQTSGKRRSRRSIGDPNDPNLIGDDVQDATATPKEAKPGFTTNIKATDLASQISWLDFGDTANWSGATITAKGDLALQVGATYTKEIMPGYVVKIKVKSLKPFQATEIYKKRLEERGATEAEKATYDPNARNGYMNGTNTPATRAAFSAGEEAKVIAEAQTRWSEIRGEGINTGNKKTTISSELESGNIGVQFEVSATFRGKDVKPAIVMADGESANPGELVLFTTNGEGWQHIGEWYKYGNKSTKAYIPQDTDNLFGSNPATKIDGINYYSTNLDLIRRSNQVGPDKKAVAWKYFGSADLTTAGLGTGVFGPNISSIAAVPLVMTRGASEVGLYIASSGKQSAMLGFFPLDEGDAPASYGKAIHSIATVDGITGMKVNQPYLGHLSPDMDENNTLDWFGDDNATTADEGVDQLIPGDLKGKTNEMIKMDRTHPGDYTITVEAHTDGAPKAYIYGWIDFNQNGTFDEDERSDLATITKDGSVTLRFTKSKTYIDPSVTELGVRARIAKDDKQIESPTGMAFSGEVEDFKTQVTHPPKGEVKETTGPQFEKQTATVAFTARGLYKYSRTENAKIDETVAPQMVDNRTGQVVTPGADGYYAVAGQGKYKITPNGTSVDVEFIPEDHFLGTADGISIRRTDTNGYDTGWSTKFPDMEANVDTAIRTMDGLYIPTVTPKDIEGENKTSTDVQGATQTGTPTFNVVGTNLDGNKVAITPSALYPAKLVDPATGQPTNALSVKVAGEGTYTIDDTTGQVTFVPEPGFTGTANGVTVSLSAPVGRDKDGTIRDEYVKTATAKYTPTVTPITVTPTNKVSEDIQNIPQTQTPTFDLSNDKTAQITSKKLVDPATGQPTDATTVTVAGEGSYTIDPTTGAVTFTPEKDFVGTARGITVQATATITNAAGKTATITSDATYTPTVVAAKPTAQPAKSKDIQGATQTGTPTFAGTTVQVNGQNKPVTIKANSYKLLDKDGNEVNGTTPAYAADGITVIGNFTIDPVTGQVTFTPTDKSYTGAVTPVKVQAESSNGIKVDTTYTPEIVPVTPTATPAETTDIQGATQTGKPEFQGGTVNVDGVEKTVAINEAVPATFDDGTKTKTIPNVGTYTVAADGTVTFVPEKSFIGTAPAVTVVREDMNGTKAQATYTPTVTPVKPTGTPVTSTDIQGATQTGKPVFTEGDSRVPMDDTVPATFEDGSTTKTVDGVGTYTVAPDGTVTFKPLPTYVGTPEGVTVKRVDKNGTPATAKYTPTVTPVKPTAEPATSTDKQGQTQTGKPVFTAGTPSVPMDDTVPATFEDGSTTKTVPGEGTYTVAPDGTVTFVPEKSFTGTGTGVTVKRVDKNGTPATAKYTPTVTPVTPTATPATSEAPQGVVQTGTVTFTEGDPVAPIDKDTITLLDENGQPAASVVAKSPEGKEIGTYTVDKTSGVVTFTPTDKSYSGEVVPVKVQAKDTNGTPAETTYTPKITPVVPTAEPATSTDIQGKTQTGKPTFTEGNPSVPMDDTVPATFEDGSTTKTIPGEGTYTVAPDGTVTFVPEKSFTGLGTGVTVKRVDKNGTPATAKYTPTVTPVTPTATPAESEEPQGVVQTGTVTFTEGDPVAPIDKDTITLLDENGQPAASVVAKSPEGKEIGTFTVDKETGVVTFTPTDKSYSGEVVAVKVQAKDTNGTPAETTYTPKITPVVPTAEPATSTDIQGKTQTGKPNFTPGNPAIPMDDDVPATFEDGSTTKTIPGEGTYTVAPDGTVTFVPEKSFTGTGTGVTVKRVDKNGTPATAKYTPTVTPVTPTATPATSTNVQGATQTGKPVFTEGDSRVPLNDDVPATFDDGSTTKTVDGVGTYTVAADGTVTFVPEKSFVGTAPAVTVVREDVNGTKAQATYTPTVTPVTPTADPVASTDIQGQTQTGKPNFTPGHPSVPMDDDVPATFEDGSTTKTIPGEGTYTVAPDGTVTFVPEKSFTGKGTGVTVKRVDKNGTPVTATYTPTVTPVAPTAEPVTSIGNKGQTQTGKPVFTEGDSRVPMNDKVPATFDDGSTTKTIPGVGTYTVAADGTVTFTPEPEFTGTAPAVTVVREDVNGTKAQATYTPTVRPITKFVDKEGKEIPGYPTVDGEEPKAKIPGYRFVETKKLPNGDFEHVYEKVTTSHVDENGKPIPGYPTEDGEQPKKDIPGYDFVKSVVDKDGNIQHIYKKTVTPSPMPTPTPQPQPKPEEPTVPVVPETKEEVTYIDPQDPTAQLPNTGTKESSTAGLAIFSALAGLSLFGLAKRKKED